LDVKYPVLFREQTVPRGELTAPFLFTFTGSCMNKHIAVIFILANLITSLTFTVYPAKASPQTIIVPDDYPSIADAVGNATDGATIFVRKGTYQEHSIEINKTLSLIGEAPNTTIIEDIDPQVLVLPTQLLPENSAPIKIAADNIKISGFTLTNGGNGISGTGSQTQITDNLITAPYGCINLKGSNITITQNIIENNANGGLSGYGIKCNGYYNTIASNRITGPNNYAITIEHESSLNVVCNNTIVDAGSIHVYGNRNVVAKNSLTHGGISIDGTSNTVYSNRIEGSGFGLVGYNNTFYANYLTYAVNVGSNVEDAANNIFYDNNFVGSTQVGGWIGVRGPNFWDNGVEGNFWSDYNGTDSNNDGIGDFPYTIDANNQDNYPLMAPYNIDSVIAELPEWANTSPPTPPFPTPTPNSPPNTSTSTATPNPTQITPTLSTIATPTTTPALTNSTEASSSPSVTQQPSPSTSTPAASGGVGSPVDGLWIGVAVAVVVGVVVGVLFRRKRLGA
jgi:hypothetical protein